MDMAIIIRITARDELTGIPTKYEVEWADARKDLSQFRYYAEIGTEEARLYEKFLKPRDWVGES